jgi:hypothetical protein
MIDLYLLGWGILITRRHIGLYCPWYWVEYRKARSWGFDLYGIRPGGRWGYSDRWHLQVAKGAIVYRVAKEED